MLKKIFFFLFLNIIFLNSALTSELNLYSSRHYESDFGLYKKFFNKTGIKVNLISGKHKALEKRIIEEGDECIADLYIVSDAGRLYNMQSKNLFQIINSDYLDKNVPKNLKNNYWYPISKRARIFFFDPLKTSSDSLKNINYEDLANPKWKGKILIRKADNIYNQSLVASMIEIHGIEKAKSWVNGLVKNMARSPKGNDRAQILGVASGEGEIAVANSYYFALMLSGQKGNEQKKAAERLKPFFPNQENRGTHMNISGAGILKNSPNKKNAIKFIEFLLTEDAQKHIVSNNFEYPVTKNILPHQIIIDMGLNFKQDTTTKVSSYGKWQSTALKIMIEAGWK